MSNVKGSDPFSTIGGLARRTRCKAETIRYYERIGLLEPPPRSAGGHRQYGEAAVKRLSFILRARDLGFRLASVRALLALADGRGGSCGEVASIASRHLDDVRRKVGELAVLEKVLARMVRECRTGQTPRCPLIEALFGADGARSRIPW